MAKRKLSAKQIKAGFGGKRRQSSLKRKRHAPAKKRAAVKRRVNGSTGYHGPSLRKLKKQSKKEGRWEGAWKHEVMRQKHKKTARRQKSRAAKAARRKNVGEILVLTAGNPAKKGKRTMAKKRYTKKKRASAKRSNTAGRRTKRSFTRKMRRRNPGGISMRPADLIKGGVGVIAGGVGTRLLPQLVLPSMNNGPTGYALNAGAALLLAWGAHAFTKDKVLTGAVAAGGFAALILRVVNDQSSVGKYLSLTGAGGMGDYMVSNWTQPQRLTDPRGAMFEMGGVGPAAMVAARNGEDGTGNC